MNNGEKFDVVAREMSEDKAKAGEFEPPNSHLWQQSHGHAHTLLCPGGSLGWKNKGELDPQFEEVAFKLRPSQVDKPEFERVKTGFGYHIIMVEDRK